MAKIYCNPACIKCSHFSVQTGSLHGHDKCKPVMMKRHPQELNPLEEPLGEANPQESSNHLAPSFSRDTPTPPKSWPTVLLKASGESSLLVDRDQNYTLRSRLHGSNTIKGMKNSDDILLMTSVWFLRTFLYFQDFLKATLRPNFLNRS